MVPKKSIYNLTLKYKTRCLVLFNVMNTVPKSNAVISRWGYSSNPSTRTYGRAVHLYTQPLSHKCRRIPASVTPGLSLTPTMLLDSHHVVSTPPAKQNPISA